MLKSPPLSQIPWWWHINYPNYKYPWGRRPIETLSQTFPLQNNLAVFLEPTDELHFSVRNFEFKWGESTIRKRVCLVEVTKFRLFWPEETQMTSLQGRTYREQWALRPNFHALYYTIFHWSRVLAPHTAKILRLSSGANEN